MSSKDTHLIPSGLALAVWSWMMLVLGKRLRVTCFVACLQSHMSVNLTLPPRSWQHDGPTRQVFLDSTAISCYLYTKV